MSEIIRSLIFILIIETAFFAIIKKPVCSVIDATDFVRRRNLWFALTIVAFVTQNFWIYTALALLLLFYAYKKETNPIALFCSVLFVLPVVNVDIPGVGGIRLIFELSNLRLLELAILFPLFLSLRKQSDTIRFGRTNADKIFALYLILNCLLYFRDFNITNNLRSIFYLFIDVFLGYYVFSRVLKSLQNFRETILSLLISILILAPLGVFEFLRNWLLYSALAQNLSLTPDSFTDYLERDGMLRAAVTTGQSIVLGYLFVVGIGLYIFFNVRFKNLSFVILAWLYCLPVRFLLYPGAPGSVWYFCLSPLLPREKMFCETLQYLPLQQCLLFRLFRSFPAGRKY